MLVRRLARPLLATWFITEGVDALRHTEAHVEKAEAAVRDITAKGPGLEPPDRDQVRTLVRVHGAVMAVAGAMLALGKAPRLAGTVLAAATVPLVVADQPFDRSVPEPERGERRTRFVQRLALLGGALLAAVDTAGRPGMGWRIAHARRSAGRQVKATTAKARATTKRAARR